MGIIDFVGLYKWEKKVESMSKKIIVKAGTTPTIINAKSYSMRF
jgi:hypothetical protein